MWGGEGPLGEQHYRRVARLVLEGKVVPFLGAGVNVVGRSAQDQFTIGRSLPTGTELADHLARAGEITIPDDNLARVSQHLAVLTGPAALYDELHKVFDHDYEPTVFHHFLAELPAILRASGAPQYQFIITTNYDDALERAFAEAGEPVDVVVYIAEGEHQGKFLHRDADGTESIVHLPNKYEGLALEERTVIAKIHGAIDRETPDGDSFVITEDHYIEYLTRTDISSLIPVTLVAKITKSHFLFLGYSLRDWNLRVILHRIWGAQRLRYMSWAVQRQADPVEQQSWASRNVTILEASLEDYLVGLRAALVAEAAAP